MSIKSKEYPIYKKVKIAIGIPFTIVFLPFLVLQVVGTFCIAVQENIDKLVVIPIAEWITHRLAPSTGEDKRR